MDWKIGDVVVCIKIGPLNSDGTIERCPPLRLNSEYIIQNIYQCPKCKSFSFDVGLLSGITNGQYNGTSCCTETIPCKEIHWCSSTRFVKKKTKEEQIAEAIEKEDYEKASELRDELKTTIKQ